MDFFFQAEDGIRYLVRSRGLGDVYKRQLYVGSANQFAGRVHRVDPVAGTWSYVIRGMTYTLSLIHI